jgi:hypothetical protein
LTPNYQLSVDFLRKFKSTGFWIVTAVTPDRTSIETRPFAVSEGDALIAWLERKGSNHNIYFSVNSTARPVNKKAEREDIATLDFVHVDIDPRPGEPVDAERERAIRLLSTELPKGVPPPTFVIDSGGGAWGFWRLSDPMAINGESEKYEEAKRFNLQLEILFGADSCHNVDRIARLPGTINWPNDRKKAKGQVPRLSTVVSANELSYPLDSFTPAPLVQGAEAGFSAGHIVKVSGNVRRLNSVDELGEKVSRLCRVVIVQGHDPEEPNKWPSRSEPLFWVCCELIRAGCDDDTIFSVITDPGFAISESVINKGSRAERYAIRQIERAREEAIHPRLRELNEKHAVIGDISGKCRIVSENFDEALGRQTLSYQSFEDFHHRYGNQFIESGADGKVISIPLGKWWTLNPNRRSYERIVFAPGKDIVGCYNLWKGFACDARPGSCSLFLEHVRNIICSGDPDAYAYLIGWMAHAVQRPDQQGHVAIVLRGKRGTGKGVFATCFGNLFGRHFMQVVNSEHLLGKFNAHLRDCVILFADEAFYAGDKKHESLLKTMITEDTIVSESKGVDAGPARNYIHLVMASNDDWVIPAGADERRFLMLHVANSHIQDMGYFRAIRREYENGGKEALLHYLMNYSLADFDPRQVPKTDALQEQKQHSFTPEQEWWFAKLERGEVFEGEGWPTYVVCTQLAHDFTSYMQLWNKTVKSNSSKLGRFMQQVIPDGAAARKQLAGRQDVIDVDGQVKSIERPRIYSVPTLERCREHFATTAIGGKFRWPSPITQVLEPQVSREPF